MGEWIGYRCLLCAEEQVPTLFRTSFAFRDHLTDYHWQELVQEHGDWVNEAEMRGSSRG